MSVIHGDCRDVLPTLAPDSFDSVVTDPPYGLEFMGKEWDKLRNNWQAKPGTYHNDTTFLSRGDRVRYKAGAEAQEFHHAWSSVVLRVLKPGGYMPCFGGTRTYHRLACAVEDAGFEIRDCLMWLYGSGFPKGQGCLKPAWEPILLCRKPGKRVLPLQIDACRVECGERPLVANPPKEGRFAGVFREGSHAIGITTAGRWPANVVHDGSEEALEAFAAFGEKTSGKPGSAVRRVGSTFLTHAREVPLTGFGDTSTAARFFYCAKASKVERAGSKHPTVKPLALVRWLVRLVTPEGGRVLDPFAGSGTTLEAAALEGREAVGIEREADYLPDIERRLKRAREQAGLFAEATAP